MKRLIKENHAVKNYVTAFDYINKILIALSATSGGVSIISFTSVFGVPIGIASSIFSLIFSLTTVIVKNITKHSKKKKRKTMIKFLCWLKVNSIASKH